MSQDKPPPRVLLVEDDATSRAIVTALLGRLGIEPQLAANADEVHKALSQGIFNLIVMDVMLDGVSGIEITKQIRAKESGTANHTLIVALTGLNTPEDRKKCLDAGMDGYFSKPINRVHLLEFFKKVLR